MLRASDAYKLSLENQEHLENQKHKNTELSWIQEVVEDAIRDGELSTKFRLPNLLTQKTRTLLDSLGYRTSSVSHIIRIPGEPSYEYKIDWEQKGVTNK